MAARTGRRAAGNDAETALVDALAQTAFVVMGRLTRIAARYDLSLTQLRALGVLRDRTPRMAELADFLGLDKSTLSGLIDRAEARCLVERRRSASDGRIVEVAMTERGIELAAEIHTEVRRALSTSTERLDAAQRRELTRLLELLLGEPAARGRAD